MSDTASPGQPAVQVTASEGSRPSWGIRHVVFGLLIAYGASSLLGALAAALVTGSPTLAGLLPGSQPLPIVDAATTVGLWAGFLGVPLWASYRRGARSLAVDFWLRIRWARDVPLGIVLALALLALQFGILWVSKQLGVPSDELSNTQFLQGQSVLGLLVLGLLAAIAVPLVEELFFRGLTLQAFTRRFGSAVGVAVSSILFGLVHVQDFSVGSDVIILITGLVGVAFAITTLRTKRLGAAIIGHMTFNTAGVAMAVLSLG